MSGSGNEGLLSLQSPGAEKRRSQRILLSVPVLVQGKDRTKHDFEEQTHTLVVNAHGALVLVKAELEENQRLLLRNKISGRQEECRVVWFRRAAGEGNHVGIEFASPSPRFWPVDFPPEDWGAGNTMKAALLKEFSAALEVSDIPRPFLRSDEVLIKVEACGVCHSDLHMAHGDWPDTTAKMTLPAILGHEAVGRVEEVGTAVQGIAVGARVGVGWLYGTCGECECCKAGAENVCEERKVTAIAAPGGYAEFMRIRASHAIPVPEKLPVEEAAPLFCAGLTVYHAFKNAGIQKGQRVAVFGIGGLGHLAVQLAKNAGCEVVAVDVSMQKLELAQKLGAKDCVLAGTDYAEPLLKGDGGPQVAIVTATVKSAYDLAFNTLRRRGTLVVVGLPKEHLTFFADDLVVGEFKIIGSAVGTRAEMKELLTLAVEGKIRCLAETFRLEQINEVYARMERGEIIGRAVIKM